MDTCAREIGMTDPRCSAERVVEVARRWIGTPYVHQASCRSVGTDCLGLIRGVWRELLGGEPGALPAYSPDWGEDAGAEYVLEAAHRHLVPLPVGARVPGSVLVFRMQRAAVAKHLGILGTGGPGLTLIHAYSGRAVVEHAFGEAWARRVAGAFAFPAPRQTRGE